MADEQSVSTEQLAMMDDLDYVPELDEGTSASEEEVKVEGEAEEPIVKPEKEQKEVEVKPEEEAKKEEKQPTEAELLKVYKEQLTHFQKLYEEEKKDKELKLQEAQKAKVPAEEPARTAPTQEQIRAHYIPEVKKTIDNGYMSEEFANSYPDEAVQLLYHRDIIYNLVKRVGEVVTLLNQQHGTSQASGMDNTINSLFDTASKKDEFYAPLAEPEVRTKFKEYLLELNPFVDQINEEFITRQWLAYNKEVILEAAKIAAKGGKAPDTRSDARGEGSGNRPGKSQKSPEVRPWDEL